MKSLVRILLALAIIGVPGSAAAQDVEQTCNEPAIRTALSVGDIFKCLIESVGDSDIFDFTATGGDVLMLTVVDRSGGSPQITCQVFPPTDPPFLISPSNTGQRVQFTAEAGGYVVLCNEVGDDETNLYSIALETLFPAPSGAPTLALDTPVADAIQVIADADVYVFPGTSGESLRLTVTDQSGGNPRIRCELFAPDEVTSLGVLSPSNTGTVLPFDVQQTGNHTLLCHETGDDEGNSYSLALQTLFPPPAGAVDLVIDTPLADTISPVADSDVFLFTGVANDTLVWAVTDESGGNPRITCALYGPDELMIHTLSPSNTGTGHVFVPALSGTHTILCNEAGNDEGNSYSIALQSLFPPPPLALGMCDGCVSPSVLSPVADSDVYMFNGVGGETLLLTLTDQSGGNPRPIGDIYDPSGTLIASLTPSNTGQNTQVPITMSGPHTILVYEAGWDEGNTYSFALTCLFGVCDTDGDGIPDNQFAQNCVGGNAAGCNDNCRSVFNTSQTDTGTIASPANPTGAGGDGVGDPCQCGDVSGDGICLGNDSTLIRRHLLGLAVPVSFNLLNCNIAGTNGNLPNQCEGNDATVLRRNLLGLGPAAILDNCIGPRLWSEGRP